MFSYEGSVETGTTVTYGAGYTASVSASQYRDLLAEYSGRSIPAGTSRDAPPQGSLGAWLQAKVTPTAIASYVGAILVAEGYATREGSTIRFKQKGGTP